MDMPRRKWADGVITKAPVWCSVDLRDGNQALEAPMTLAEKFEFFDFLLRLGFKTIEVGYPSASDTDFEFVRRLITENLIPADVVIQVPTQCREDVIRPTFESLIGVRKAIIHFYNPTSAIQREAVFKMSKDEVKKMAVDSALMVKRYAREYGEDKFEFQYSPESFTGTEMDFAVDICNAVIDAIDPSPDKKLILNLPGTVEMSMPNIYADQIEYVINNLNKRDCVLISIHAHNDRGCAVAATELALLAGADRVEGTLFGNGERTGNADLVTLAMNLYSQGIDPELDFGDIDEVIRTYDRLIKLPVHPRHPYAGGLVYTAFSASHQDAINKSMAYLKNKDELWQVPYLPIDPRDVGRTYEQVIRITSQSGKGGVAYVLETNYGLQIPKPMQLHFSKTVKKVSDTGNKELHHKEIYDLFLDEYVNIQSPLRLEGFTEKTFANLSRVDSAITYNGTEYQLSAEGDGLLDAFANSLADFLRLNAEVSGYSQHALDHGNKSRAMTYITIKTDKGNYFGASIRSSISNSSLCALVSAVNRYLAEK
jgi:2-isopropylmalate synthase